MGVAAMHAAGLTDSLLSALGFRVLKRFVDIVDLVTDVMQSLSTVFFDPRCEPAFGIR